MNINGIPTSQEAQVYVLQRSNNKKPVQINLTYQNPKLENSEPSESSFSHSEEGEKITKLSAFPSHSRKPICQKISQQEKTKSTVSNTKKDGTEKPWALGGLVFPQSGRSGLGWISAHHYLIEILKDPRIECINYDIKAIIFMFPEDKIVGEGGMRQAYKMEVS
ncbi:alphaK I3 [Puccinia sorghi]|uniref:AlphaK I3 n=1 Tax=Puccinia sorghi TaxID=27349 RepID=A0A0L6V8C9_9BASI|nr:alphaK I3 [Puccinia sorghi]